MLPSLHFFHTLVTIAVPLFFKQLWYFPVMSSLAKMFRSVKNNKPLAQALREKKFEKQISH
ncbi:hypothetical protein DOY81_013094 [Sarcophaga bullata]|nr:hypothetical protein DOY81_013094 [Sarcophaga bullata]